MQVTVLSVGKVRQKFILEGEQEYSQRIAQGMRLELKELGIESPESQSAAVSQDREAKELEPHLAKADHVIVLDERGKLMTTMELKDHFQSLMNRGTKQVAFVIGGSFGTAERIRQRADVVLSLSRLTFPHQLARLLMVEQLYRIQTLMRGIRYHK